MNGNGKDTTADLADMVKTIQGMPEAERQKLLAAFDEMGQWKIVAEAKAKDQAKLVEETEDLYRRVGKFYMEVAEATEKAKIGLLETLRARTAIADQHIAFLGKFGVARRKQREGLNEYFPRRRRLNGKRQGP